MKLPHGTFHSIKKNKLLKELIKEVHEQGFTGSILIFVNNIPSAIVVKNGVIILAEYLHLSGNDALREINKFGDQLVDAEFTNFTDIQLSLAQEFNKSSRVQGSFGSPILFVKKEQFQVENSGLIKDDDTTKISNEMVTTNPISSYRNNKNFDSYNSGNTFSDSLEALETIDLEKMEGKIRINAKNIAKKLDFDHLIVDEQEQGS